MAEIISRADAKAAGLKWYFTGKPCKRQHVAERLLSNGTCVECRALVAPALNAAYRASPKGREKKREHAAMYNALPETREAKRVHINAMNATPRGREMQRTRNNQPAARARRAEHTSRRRVIRRAQACTCCTSADFARIYTFANWLGSEVDHREPLALGGSHCKKNLQVLTKSQHKEKTKSDMARIAEARRNG